MPCVCSLTRTQDRECWRANVRGQCRCVTARGRRERHLFMSDSSCALERVSRQARVLSQSTSLQLARSQAVDRAAGIVDDRSINHTATHAWSPQYAHTHMSRSIDTIRSPAVVLDRSSSISRKPQVELTLSSRQINLSLSIYLLNQASKHSPKRRDDAVRTRREWRWR